MENNQITFELKDGGVRLHYRKPINFEDFLTVIQTGILSAMRSIVHHTPDEQKEVAIEDLYDMYNAAASNMLTFFAPDIEMRPHLTTQAILEAENRIIEEGRAPSLLSGNKAKKEKPTLQRVK